MNILISACLIGVDCRYNGTSTKMDALETLMVKYNLIPVCPEIFGGLETPREPAEIIEGRVMTISGRDVTAPYERGAKEVLSL